MSLTRQKAEADEGDNGGVLADSVDAHINSDQQQ